MQLFDRTNRYLVILLAWLGGGACGSAQPSGHVDAAQDASTCLAPLSLDCQVAFPPTYPNLFNDLFLPTCGSPNSGSSCHGPNGRQGGLVLSNVDMAYDDLLGHVDGRARVIPNDPECSILEQRLESNDPSFRMPRGSMPLPQGVLCAVRQWIANGAPKQ